MVEQLTFNQLVLGSSPRGCTNLKTDHQTRNRTGTASSAAKQMLRGFHCSVPQLFIGSS
jgi:hypothetical protein